MKQEQERDQNFKSRAKKAIEDISERAEKAWDMIGKETEEPINNFKAKAKPKFNELKDKAFKTWAETRDEIENTIEKLQSSPELKDWKNRATEALNDTKEKAKKIFKNEHK